MAMLIGQVRSARRKALAAARAEVVALLRDLNAKVLPGGPLGERGGQFWVQVDDPPSEGDGAGEWSHYLRPRLAHLGYSTAVGVLEPAAPDGGGRFPRVRWQGRDWSLVPVYREDVEAMRDQAPDRRTFLLADEAGQVPRVRGYRGSSAPLARRALPVCDARLLVNLVRPIDCEGDNESGRRLLDPCAGAGGTIQAAVAAGCRALSCDIDPILAGGLRQLGACHQVADARHLPFADQSMDAIATEPPYDASTGPMLIAALAECARVLRSGGRVAFLCAAWQAPGLREAAATMPLCVFLDCPVDREGTGCHVLAWEKGRG